MGTKLEIKIQDRIKDLEWHKKHLHAKDFTGETYKKINIEIDYALMELNNLLKK